MNLRPFSLILLCALCVFAANPTLAASIPPAGNDIPANDRQQLEAGVSKLGKEIDALKVSLKSKPNLLALLPDVQIYHKVVDWPLRFHELIDVKKAEAALARGMERAKSLREGKAPWLTAGGVRAYVSKIDGSIQPYLLSMPRDYAAGNPPQKKYRLDFFFHGRGEKLTELAFISAKGEAPAATGEHFNVQPYGRYCCANKFAGEIDTLEILDQMKRDYPIDENRVVVTGFSMGGAACWHIAVHYTDLWAAASPGAGFAETRLYQKMDASGEWNELPEYRKQLMHLYDCPDYALNLSMLPLIAYAGEIDPQQQSGDIMQKAMADLGLKLERIYGPKTAHKYEPGAKKELDKRLDAYAAKGRNIVPKEVHFETWTLRYNHMFWVRLEGLDKHWERARVDAAITSPNAIDVKTTNVASLILDIPAIASPLAPDAKVAITLNGEKLEAATNHDKGLHAAFAKTGDQWKLLPQDSSALSLSKGALRTQDSLRKRPALQGPIDDAFLDSFIIVKPTGQPLNDKVGKWCASETGHAITEWRKIFRGEPRVTSDQQLTDADIANNNLVLFGDPSSNAILKKIAGQLPIAWNAQSITLGDKTFPADHHAVVMIYPNPLNPNRYVVLNSGFTFRQADHKTNSRQIAKLPDYAIIDLTTPPDDKAPGAIPAAGFFNEAWQLRKEAGGN
jgi:pimeloyl-ACP methyl ester carboxylesterase